MMARCLLLWFSLDASIVMVEPFSLTRHHGCIHRSRCRTTCERSGTTIATTRVFESSSEKDTNDDDDGTGAPVQLGSKEYIQGMVTRPVQNEPTDRVTGDKVLGLTLRLAGGVTSVLMALVGAFLLANGII